MLKRGQVWISACDHRVNGAAGFVSKEEEECLPLYPASDTLRVARRALAQRGTMERRGEHRLQGAWVLMRRHLDGCA